MNATLSPDRRFGLSLAAAIAPLLVIYMAGDSQASIHPHARPHLVHDLSFSSFDGLIERDMTSDTSDGAGQLVADVSEDSLPDLQDDEGPPWKLAPFTGGSGDAGTKVNGASGGGLPAAITDAYAIIPHAPWTGHIFERSLFPPDAPGTELLKPPKDS